MEILKRGDPDRVNKALQIKLFKCNDCGCEFVADKSEYKYEGWEELPFGGEFVDKFSCACPCCKSEVNYLE